MSPNDPTPKPTIEERLQAVVQTLQLVAVMQRDHEKALAESDQRWNNRAAQWDARFDKLLTIVESHDRRLSGLEGQ